MPGLPPGDVYQSDVRVKPHGFGEPVEPAGQEWHVSTPRYVGRLDRPSWAANDTITVGKVSDYAERPGIVRHHSGEKSLDGTPLPCGGECTASCAAHKSPMCVEMTDIEREQLINTPGLFVRGLLQLNEASAGMVKQSGRLVEKAYTERDAAKMERDAAKIELDIRNRLLDEAREQCVNINQHLEEIMRDRDRLAELLERAHGDAGAAQRRLEAQLVID